MDKLPLDARLLSNAVIELNIARHILTLYAKDHQLVQLSLDKTFAIFAELFELRSEITLAVARDVLIVDGHQLDQKNPVFREFALALSRMSVAFVSFVKGLTREEAYDFFRFLSRETEGISSETLPQILKEYQLLHVLIEPLDYRAFGFTEKRSAKAGPDKFLLERHIKNLLEGGLPAEGLRQVIKQVEPEALAALMNNADTIVSRETTYDTVVSSYLRHEEGQPFSGADLQRLMAFANGLRPELKQQFLSFSFTELTHNPAAVGQALEAVPVDSIIQFFGEIDQQRRTLPEALVTLIARFSRTGSELPSGGLNVDDILLSSEVANLVKEEGTHQHGPESYEAEIRRIVEAPGAAGQGLVGLEFDHEMDKDYIRYCHANALLALLDSPLPHLIALEDEVGYVPVFTTLAQRSAKSGQYAQLLELLTRLDDLERRGRHRALVTAVREFCREAEFVATIVDSLRRHGRGNRAGAAMICSYYGEEIVAPLFDLLTDEERPYVRKMLLQLLIGLGEHVARVATPRLRDARWHVRRNALYLLAESGARCDPRLLVPLCDDQDPRVRLECARCLIRAGETAGVRTLRALLNDKTGVVVDAAIAAAGALGLQQLFPDLVELAKKPTGGAGIGRALRVVRTLGQLGGDQAADALRELLEMRIFLFPRENKRFRSEIRKVLLRVSGKSPGDTAQRDVRPGKTS